MQSLLSLPRPTTYSKDAEPLKWQKRRRISEYYKFQQKLLEKNSEISFFPEA
jgi:hypothetical protein